MRICWEQNCRLFPSQPHSIQQAFLLVQPVTFEVASNFVCSKDRLTVAICSCANLLFFFVIAKSEKGNSIEIYVCQQISSMVFFMNLFQTEKMVNQSKSNLSNNVHLKPQWLCKKYIFFRYDIPNIEISKKMRAIFLSTYFATLSLTGGSQKIFNNLYRQTYLPTYQVWMDFK